LGPKSARHAGQNPRSDSQLCSLSSGDASGACGSILRWGTFSWNTPPWPAGARRPDDELDTVDARFAANGRLNPDADTLVLDDKLNQVKMVEDLIDVKAIFNLFCPVMTN
jgi:hypothetical protein